MPFFHAAISKSGAGQLDLLILEANSLHGEVGLCHMIVI